MISIFQAIVLGIVEGITEFLPISSTGHLILAANLLKIIESEFVKSFEIIIQLGAILAVVFLYGKKILYNKQLFLKITAAFIPTGIIGLLIYKVAKQYFLGNSHLVIYSLFIGGLVLIFFEKWYAKDKTEKMDISKLTYKHAVILGVVQSLAIVPGVSRAAATIVGGLALGYDRKSIVEFSFLLAIPTMLAATGLDLIKNGNSFDSSQVVSLGIGFVVSFITAIIAVKWLVKFIKGHTFTGFGIYRVLVAAAAYFII
ncbi:MAG: undecaprenyl-diphosphatase UppP [Patescibacteria group bacterium]|jgi:undecaprenyl-diphosphatase